MKWEIFKNKSNGFQESIRADARKVLNGKHDEDHKNRLIDKLRVLRILDNGSELEEFCYKVLNA